MKANKTKLIKPRDLSTIKAQLETSRISLRNFVDKLISENEDLLNKELMENQKILDMPMTFFYQIGGTLEAANTWIDENENLTKMHSHKKPMDITSLRTNLTASIKKIQTQKTKNISTNQPIVTSDFTKQLVSIPEIGVCNETSSNNTTKRLDESPRYTEMFSGFPTGELHNIMKTCAKLLHSKRSIDLCSDN